MDRLEVDIAAFRRIADALPTPMWALDADGVLVWVNAAAAEFAALTARLPATDG